MAYGEFVTCTGLGVVSSDGEAVSNVSTVGRKVDFGLVKGLEMMQVAALKGEKRRKGRRKDCKSCCEEEELA